MDEEFDYFLSKMGPALEERAVPPATTQRYRGVLPEQLLAYWDKYGWCGYADGLLWTVDPQEYQPVLDAWLEGTEFMSQDRYHIIARSAFGDLYLWGERTGNSLEICTANSLCVPRRSLFVGEEADRGIRMFFGLQTRGDNDFDGLFAGAVKKLGRLKPDEMYGFVPALAFGTPAAIEHLEKVKAVEHLVLLAQLQPLRVLPSPVL